MSCIFTLTRPRRRVPRRRRARDGLQRGAAAVRPRDHGARLAARVIRVLIALLRPDRARRRARLPRRGAPLRLDLERRSVALRRRWPSSSRTRVRAHPGLPGRRRLRAPETSRCWPPTSRPEPPLPAVVEAVHARHWAAQPLPGPDERRAAQRAVASATASRRSGSRSATARATSCSPPARRCSSPAPSSSTPGRRSASIRTSRRPRAPRAIQVPLDAEHEHDLDAMARRDHRRDAAGDRLQPEQPDVDGAAARRDRGVRRERCRATSA